jgi:hypothetical protein
MPRVRGVGHARADSSASGAIANRMREQIEAARW